MSATINNITTAGLNAIVNVAANGYQAQLNVASFKLGSLNSPFDQNATDVPGSIVYSGGPPALKAIQTSDPNTILYSVSLDSSIGGFTFGSIGLYLSTGELLTYSPLNNLVTKVGDSLPNQMGDYLTYYFPVQIVRSSDIFTITADPISFSALPRIATASSLPLASTTQFNAYLISADETLGGRPSVAFTDGVNWYHISGLTGSAAAKFATTVFGDGSSTSFTVNHGLQTLDVISQVYSLSVQDTEGTGRNPVATYGGQELGFVNRCDIFPTSTDAVVLNFQSAPAAGAAYRVVVIG